MEDKIAALIRKRHPGVDVAAETALFDDGILASMDIVILVTELNMTFDIAIPAYEILPENFNSVAALSAMVERLLEA